MRLFSSRLAPTGVDHAVPSVAVERVTVSSEGLAVRRLLAVPAAGRGRAWAAMAICAPALLAAATLPLRAQSVSFAGVQTTVDSALDYPQGVAVDRAGDVFIADSGNNTVVKVPAGCANTACQTTVGTGLIGPTFVAVDGAGDVFISEPGDNNLVVKVPAGCTSAACQTTVGSGLYNPRGVAVDGAGDVFIADTGSNQVVEVPAGGGAQITVASGLDDPFGVAVDGAGDVFIADTGSNRVVEVPAGGGAQITVASGLNNPLGVAVDGAGDVFISEPGDDNLVLEVPAGCTSAACQTTVGTTLNQPTGVAVDGAGDVFIGESANNQVVKVQTRSVNFGSVNVGASTSLTLNYNIDSSVTVSSVNVVTQGAPNLDFTRSSTTCTGSEAAGSTCTVTVSFAVRAPGVRMGAVELTGSSGSVLATTFLHGIGQGPAIAFDPGLQTTVLGSGLANPSAVAVDAAGDVFIADTSNSRVVEVPAGGGAQTTVASGVDVTQGVAVDGAGNVFISSTDTSLVVEVPAGGGAQTTVGSGWQNPSGIAVDGAGDVFIADTNNNRVVEVPAGGGAQTTVVSGLNLPSAVAVDARGDLFVADSGISLVVEVPAGGGAQITVGSGLAFPNGVAVDAAGDVFIADTNNKRVVEVPAGGGAQTTVGSGLSYPHGMAVDGAGDIFIADTSNLRVVELQRVQPSSLSFASTQVGQTSSDSPQSVQIQNIGNQPLTAVQPGLVIGANFDQVPGDGTAEDCSSGFSLTPGQLCNLSISFEPQSAGTLSSTAVFTDNALNGNPATQTITLNGTGTQASQTIAFTALGTQTAGTTATLSASSSSNGTITFGSTTPSVCTVSGSKASFLTGGTCTLTASVPANNVYAAATTSQSFTVIQKTQTITFSALPSSDLQGTILTLTATASSGLPVSFTSLTPTLCSVSGSTATLLQAGACTIQASQSGNTTYAPAASVSKNVTVIAAFTITPNPSHETIDRGDIAAFLLELKAASGFTGKVTLSCSGGPSGSYCADFPLTVSFNKGIALAISGVFFPAKTTPGTYTLTFTGTSGSIVDTASATFIVEAKP